MNEFFFHFYHKIKYRKYHLQKIVHEKQAMIGSYKIVISAQITILSLYRFLSIIITQPFEKSYVGGHNDDMNIKIISISFNHLLKLYQGSAAYPQPNIRVKSKSACVPKIDNYEKINSLFRNKFIHSVCRALNYFTNNDFYLTATFDW